jgi:L-arabinose isomerase
MLGPRPTGPQMAGGESVPGRVLEIGNTNSRYRFSPGVRNSMNDWNANGPAHHCDVGVGHIAGKLKKLEALLNMDCIQVC